MRLMLAALLFANPQDGPLEHPPRCDEMRRLSEAANRVGSFRILVHQGFVPHVLRYGCEATGPERYNCGQNLTPSAVTPERYAIMIRDCLSGATMAVEEERWRDPAYVVRHGRFTASLDHNCTSLCRAGRIMGITFSVDATRAPVD